MNKQEKLKGQTERSDKELLELLLENLEQGIESGWSGMCGVTLGLMMKNTIDKNEYDRLGSIILENPTERYKTDGWFFVPYTIEPRKEYLKQLIEKYS